MTEQESGPTPHDDEEAEEAVELLAGEGPIEHPGAVEDEGTESPASDADAPPPL